MNRNDQTTYRAMLRENAAELPAAASRLLANASAAAECLYFVLCGMLVLLTSPVIMPVLTALDYRDHRRAIGLDTRAVDNYLTLAASGAMLVAGGLLLWVAGGVQ